MKDELDGYKKQMEHFRQNIIEMKGYRSGDTWKKLGETFTPLDKLAVKGQIMMDEIGEEGEEEE
jgi:hypothetical protein